MASEVEKLLDRAKRAVEKNKPDDAIAAYQAVLQAVPSNIEAMQSLGDLYTHQNKTTQAAVYYGMLFDRLTEPREEPKAVALYTRFLRMSDQPPERRARYALLLQRQNKAGEAIEHYSLAAEHFLSRGKEDEALKCMEQIAELDPGNTERQVALAQLAEKRGRGQLAARGYVRAGQLALAKGETDVALDYLAKAHQAVPEDRDAAILYGQALLMAGDSPQAVEVLDPYAKTATTSAFLKIFGEALVRAGQLDRAYPVLTELYKPAGADHALLFTLAECYAAAGEDAKAVEVLTAVRKRYRDSSNENAFAARLDKLAEGFPRSTALIEFWALIYSGLNREARYFEVLVHLFDVYLENNNMPGACDVLDRMVDIDPYDFRNQQRMELLKGRADQDFLGRVASRLGVTMTQPGGEVLGGDDNVAEYSAGDAPGGSAALDDLLVQAEIFLQYALQPKAVERLERIAEIFPGELAGNERYQSLCELAGWWPEGMERRAVAVQEEAAAPAEETPKHAAAAPVSQTGVYTQETMRDLSKIAEIGQSIYRQPTPRAMLTLTVNEIGKHLRATRCLAVVGEPGQPPQLAAEFCAPGTASTSPGQVMRMMAQVERAVPDSMGGLPLDAAAAPVLREVGLTTALAVSLTDKETQTPAGFILAGHTEAHNWKPNETYFLQTVGDQMLLGVSHTRLRSLVQTLNVADHKTGLLARSAYADRLIGEAHRAKSHDASLSVAILQIDGGPELIRQQGEALVDKYLEQVARAVTPLVRPTDLSVKYTAWSLAFILPDTTLAGALGLIEKMRQAVINARNGGAGGDSTARMTVSAGVVEAIARVDYDSEDIVTELINRAESSLEEAHRRGGDSVVSLTSPRT
jgi:diguanylate cyclase (GGDEF)-like protein